MSVSEHGASEENHFESPEVQRLLRQLKAGKIVELKPSFDSKRGQVTFPDAERITGLSSEKVISLLDFLAESGILVKVPSGTFYTCPICASKNLILISGCPVCRGESLKSGRALEHLTCGHIDMEEAFVTKTGFQCPNCKKTLKELGKDYRRISNYYRCLSCGRLIDTPVQTFRCSNCQRRTPLEEVRLDAFNWYLLNPDGAMKLAKHALDLTPVREVFEKHGFNSKLDAKVKGRSGVYHDLDIIAWYKERPDSEEKPDLLVDLAISAEPLTEESISALMIKTIDIGSQNAIILAVPAVSKTANKLASFYGIVASACEKVSDIPGEMSRILEESLPRVVRTKLGEEVSPPSPILDKSLFRFQANRTDAQVPILLAMIYEKQGESQKTMRKLLEYIESSEKRVEGVQRMKEEKAVDLE